MKSPPTHRGPLAPSWLPRHERRCIERALRKLFHRDVCSICSNPFKHNSQTAGGLDAHGNAVLVGECCMSRVAKIFVRGFYSNRNYDFLRPTNTEPSANTKLTDAQIADAIAAYRQAITATDKGLASAEQCGGFRATGVYLADYPWKSDDRDWFEQNPARAHRVREPFPGELEGIANLPTQYPVALFDEALGEIQVLMLIRQLERGKRLRAAISISADLLPLPDNEAFVHAMFEVAAGREVMPPNVEALNALVKKYAVEKSQ
jgi:hypothetical protein